MKRETKPCVLCGEPVYRGKFTSDYSWKVKKYCYERCAQLASAINQLKKIGYTVTKTHDYTTKATVSQ